MIQERHERFMRRNFIEQEIQELEKQIKPHDTGHVHTTISTLKDQYKKLTGYEYGTHPNMRVNPFIQAGKDEHEVFLDLEAYRALGNSEIALDPADRNWEYDGDGTKIYKPEAGYGTKTPIDLGDLSRIDYKYNENQLIAEFKEYVDETYGLHYSKEKFQATEFIMDGGHGTGFCIGNVLKYAQRYGKKGTRSDARKDLMKVLHYALLQLYVHDSEDKK